MKKRSLKNTPPDWDPNNPYHYHNNKGEKVVITPEDWKANVGKPYFKEIEAAVIAEQAAHPGPEYENNPNFVRNLRSVYKNNMSNNYQNYRYFASALPEGYNFTDEGLIVDPQGNYYVQSGFRQSPGFTYNSDSPLQFTINESKPIEKTITFYPINMNKRLKDSLPIDRIRDINQEKELAKDITYNIDASILGHGFQGDEYETYPTPKGVKEVNGRLVSSDKTILENLINNAIKNRPDYNNWKIKTNETQKVIPVNPTVREDGQFTHIDFSTGRPIIKQKRTLKRNGGIVYLKPF